MKRIFILGMLALAVWACSAVKETSKKSSILTKSPGDSTEYELIIIDIRFDTWYQYNYTPAKDYSNEYYRSRNLVAVTNWNDYYPRGRYHRVIDCRIDYQPNIDYGIEVNRKLFWYFKYIQSEDGIRLFL